MSLCTLILLQAHFAIHETSGVVSYKICSLRVVCHRRDPRASIAKANQLLLFLKSAALKSSKEFSLNKLSETPLLLAKLTDHGCIAAGNCHVQVGGIPTQSHCADVIEVIDVSSGAAAKCAARALDLDAVMLLALVFQIVPNVGCI